MIYWTGFRSSPLVCFLASVLFHPFFFDLLPLSTSTDFALWYLSTGVPQFGLFIHFFNCWSVLKTNKSSLPFPVWNFNPIHRLPSMYEVLRFLPHPSLTPFLTPLFPPHIRPWIHASILLCNKFIWGFHFEVVYLCRSTDCV